MSIGLKQPMTEYQTSSSKSSKGDLYSYNHGVNRYWSLQIKPTSHEIEYHKWIQTVIFAAGVKRHQNTFFANAKSPQSIYAENITVRSGDAKHLLCTIISM